MSQFYPCSPNLEMEIPPYNLAGGVCGELCTHMKSPAASSYPTERSFSGVHYYLLGYHHNSAQGPISPSGLPPVNIAKCVPWGNWAKAGEEYKTKWQVMWTQFVCRVREMMEVLQEAHASYSWIKLFTVCASKKGWVINQPTNHGLQKWAVLHSKSRNVMWEYFAE